MSRNRLTGSRNWVRSGLALFWILLGCVSGVYLFTVLTEPTLGRQMVKLSPDSQASQSPDQELAAIQENLQALSQQVAGLSDRLEDGETSTALSEPPDTASESSPPAAATAPASSTAETEPAAPSSAPAGTSDAQAEAPEPDAQAQPEAAPIEQAAAEAPAATPPPKPPEPPSVVISPLDELPAELEAASRGTPGQTPAQGAPEQTQSAAADPAAPPTPAATETAALDPIALPPAANDGSTRYGIEIGIVANRDKLRPLWREFLTNHAALVAGLQPRRVLAPNKKWRLIAGPFASAAEAEQACALFEKASRPCEATVYAGDVL